MELSKSDIKLFSLDEKITLFFHTPTLQIYPLEKNNEILQFLQDFKTKGEDTTIKQYGKEKYRQYYDFITNTIQKTTSQYITRDTNQKPNFVSVNLCIAGHCNLNCPYCFAQTDGGFHFKDYTNEDAKKIVDFLITQNNNSNGPMLLVFFGGEPFLRFDVMKYTIQYCKEKYAGYTFQYTVTTNGTILNDEIIKFLQDNHISMMLSMDGPDNEFNLRKFKNGQKSIDVVLENIEKLKKANIDFNLRATMINTNPYIVETFKFFEELKIPFSILFAYNSENKDHHYADYSAENLNAIKKQFEELERHYLDKIKKKEKIYNQEIWENINTLRYRKKRNINCAMGTTFFTILSDGTIHTCAHFMNNASHSIGTITDGVDLDKRKQYIPASIETIEECQDCWIKYLCAGGCTAQKITGGRRNDQSLGKNECELQRIVWEFYLKLYYYIMTYAPRYLIKEEKETKEVIC